MKTGNTTSASAPCQASPRASMEPGHEDREYGPPAPPNRTRYSRPQWSPVMKTGNTCGQPPVRPMIDKASMEPGHEDREYVAHPRPIYWVSHRLNGARS